MLRSSCSLLFSVISATLGASSALNCRVICSHRCLVRVDPASASFACWPKAQEHLRFTLRIIHRLALRTKLLSSHSLFIKGTEFRTVAQADSSGQWVGVDFCRKPSKMEICRVSMLAAWPGTVRLLIHTASLPREKEVKKIYHDTHSC